MKATIFAYFFIIFTLLSCGGEKTSIEKVTPPADLITAGQMKDVIVDVLLAEGATGTSELKHHDAKYQALHYYYFVLEKHKMTSKQFIENFNYYSNDTDQMEKIMNDVITALSEKQSLVRKK